LGKTNRRAEIKCMWSKQRKVEYTVLGLVNEATKSKYVTASIPGEAKMSTVGRAIG